MLAVWYEKNGAAREVLSVGELPDPLPGAGEVRVRLRASGLNPSDVKARGGSRPVIPPRVIPNSDGAGVIDRVVDVDFGANVTRYASAMRQHAVVASYASSQSPEPVLPFYNLMRLNLTLRLVFVYTMPDEAKRSAIKDIGRWIAKGRPQFAIAVRVPLRDAVAAHELVESGRKIGHVVLDIP